MNTAPQLTECDREPIHIPGAVQPFGALLVLSAETHEIVQASDNTAAYVGYGPDELLGTTFEVLLAPEHAEEAHEKLAQATEARGVPSALSFAAKGGGSIRLLASAHRSGELLLLELERDNGGAEASQEAFSVVGRAMRQMGAATSLEEACDALCSEVRGFTGYDRVMVYRFHPDAHGEVIAEDVVEDMEPYLGLHYPATDIPAQARRLYERSWLRVIPDNRYEPALLVPSENPLTGAPLDLSLTTIRSVSPVHRQYVENMGVRATLVLSLLRGDTLWGLVACHHRTPRQVSQAARAACELLASVASSQLTSRAYDVDAGREARAAQLQARLMSSTSEHGLSDGLAGERTALLRLTRSTGAAVQFGGVLRLVGDTPGEDAVRSLFDWVSRSGSGGSSGLGSEQPGGDGAAFAPPSLGGERDAIYSTDRLPEEYPPAQNYRQKATGLLALMLSHEQRDGVLFFRSETLHTVTWGGNPEKAIAGERDDGTLVLSPRASFEAWSQTVEGRSLAWTEADVRAARSLRDSLMRFVVEQARKIERMNERLRQQNEDLDAFAYVASHDLKEPLRGIYGYAYYLGENLRERLGEEERAQVDGLMRLTQRMDSLIDALLHLSRVGRLELEQASVNLNEVVEEARDLVEGRRSEVDGEVVVLAPLPTVKGDFVRIREVFANLIANGLKYNNSAKPRVEIGAVRAGERSGASEESGGDSGGADAPVIFVRDNGIGIRERFHGQVFDLFKRLHGRNSYGGGTGAGLSIVRKVVERHSGKIWIESAPGEGSTFYFTLAPNPADSVS